MAAIGRGEPARRQDRRGPVPPPMPSGASPDAVAAVHVVTRAVFGARTPLQIVELVIGVVQDLGGHVRPAAVNPPDALPIDLGLGEIDPVLPCAPAVSVARLNLEILLPPLMEDARMAVLRLRNAERLADEASVDSLTGLLNRRALFRQLTILSSGDCVVMCDLDHFKKLNDTLGHDAGDDALAAFGRVLRSEVRADDIVGRYGGEEFVIGMTNVTPEQASTRVGQIRERHQGTAPPVTFSAGIAGVRSGGARCAVVAADHALYRAKVAGRDRWAVARDDEY